ncbi:MAG: hypothetical protein RI985_513 [Chloroflexota bacterium]
MRTFRRKKGTHADNLIVGSVDAGECVQQKEGTPDWLSPCGQPGGEVYEDEGDSEDSALGDEP